jgi:hypothetical protein
VSGTGRGFGSPARTQILTLAAITGSIKYPKLTQLFWLFLTTQRKGIDMLIERTNNDQITITVSSSIDSFGLQRLIDYVKYLEATSKTKAKQSDVDKLADEINSSWWKKNRKRFIK